MRVDAVSEGMRVRQVTSLGRPAADGTPAPQKIRYGRVIKVGKRGVQVEWESKSRRADEEWLKGIDVEPVDDNGDPIRQDADLVPAAVEVKPGRRVAGGELEPGAEVIVCFRHGSPGPRQPVRRVMGKVHTVLKHGALVHVDGDEKPQARRFEDLELPIPEAPPRPVRVAKREEPAQVSDTKPAAMVPLSSEVDDLIGDVAPPRQEAQRQAQAAAPPPPVVAVPRPASVAPPPPIASPVEEQDVDDSLKKLVKNSAGAAERLLAKAAKLEEERDALTVRAGEIEQQISALREEQRLIGERVSAKGEELAKLSKAVDALAALEALNDL